MTAIPEAARGCVVPSPPAQRPRPAPGYIDSDPEGLAAAAYAFLCRFGADRTAEQMRRWLADTHLVYRIASAIKRPDGGDPDPIDAIFWAAGEVNEWRRVNRLPHYIDTTPKGHGAGAT